MNCFELIPTSDGSDPRSFIGGSPPLPVGSEWPRCRLCDDEMVHYFDVELPEESEPFQPGSRLQVFACQKHDDIAGTIYSDYERFQAAATSPQLPDNYWEINDGHYLIRLLPPGTRTTPAAGVESRIGMQYLLQELQLDSGDEPLELFKLFGIPAWAQEPEEHTCSCGAPMQMLVQLPASTGFDMVAGAPEQPSSYSPEHYCLFLGNELYLLACTEQCNPLALWPVLQ
jgi:hypothetical protein